MKIKRWLAGLLIGLLAACGGTPQQPPQPVNVRLVSPASGSVVLLGEEITLKGEVQGTGVAQVRVRINGQTHEQISVGQAGTSITSQWTPMFLGQQVVFLEAYDASNTLLARSDLVLLKVEPKPLDAATPFPTSVPTPAPTPAPTEAPSAETPTATQPTTAAEVAPTIAVAATAATAATVSPTVPSSPVAAIGPSVTVSNDIVNLRSGPGTNYALAGQLKKGQIATVVGKSADGQWWQIQADGKTAWVFGQLVQANAAANGVAVTQAPPSPTPVPTVLQPTPASTDVLTVTETPAPVAANPNRPPCDPSNRWWGVKIHNDPGYTFCVPVPFQIVPNANPDPDVIVIRWEIYGDIKSLELRMDPNGLDCGRGTTGLRELVKFTENNYVINTRFLPTGGYKLGLWATMSDGRVQDWGELNFCGKG